VTSNAPLRSGELARLAGVSADTIRYYERSFLLPAAPRSASGYRLFPREALMRVQLIRSALSIGFSVSELAYIFRERERGAVPCHRVRALAAEKLAALEERLRDLQSWRRELRITLTEWDRMLANTPRGKQARLLEALAATQSKNRRRISTVRVLTRGNQRREKQQ
jgi:MerR family copper efflux transcriptional regulator